MSARKGRASHEASEPRGRRSGRHPDAAAVVVRLTEPAVDDLDDLRRRNPQVVRWALKKMILLERDPEAGEELHRDLIGWRKLVVGDRHWRIIWRVTFDDSGGVTVDVAEVWAVGARRDAEIYAEMRARVASLPPSPKTVALTDVVGRVGKLAGTTAATAEPSQEALPDWLVERLIRTVGLSRGEVDELSLEKAVDTWAAWASRPP